MAQHNHEHEIIKECIPVSTNITIEISPASPTIQKTKTKHEIFDNVLTQIQSQIDILLKEEIEKTNTYCTEFKDDTKRNLNRIRERDENEILCERTVLLEKENNCLKNENGKTQWKSSKSINRDLLDKPETPTPINLTNRFESFHVAEKNSGPENKNNDVTPKSTIRNDKPKHVIGYDIYQNKDIDPLFIRNQLMILIKDHQ